MRLLVRGQYSLYYLDLNMLRLSLPALTLLFCAGWVHRDISCGNVLLWKDTDGRPHGKLGDLEYAKRFPSTTGSSDPKTVRPFMFLVGLQLIYDDRALRISCL